MDYSTERFTMNSKGKVNSNNNRGLQYNVTELGSTELCVYADNGEGIYTLRGGRLILMR